MNITLMNADGSRTYMIAPDDEATVEALMDSTGAEFEGRLFAYTGSSGPRGIIFREQPLNPSFKLDRSWIVQ